MDFTKKMAYSVAELEDQYKATDSGYWFNKDTMRFFKTRLTGDFRRIDDKTALFISTEKGPSGVRKATIRIAKIEDIEREGGDLVSEYDIRTFGDFNQLTTQAARKIMNKLTEKDLEL